MEALNIVKGTITNESNKLHQDLFSRLFSVLIACITTGIIFKAWIEYETSVVIEQASLAMQKSVQASKLRRARIAAESKLKAESRKRQLEHQRLINK